MARTRTITRKQYAATVKPIRQAAKAPMRAKGQPAPNPDKPGAFKVGAPSKFTPDVRKKLEDAAALGLFDERTVAAFAGISYSTLRNWIIRGQGLADAIDEAQSSGQPDPALSDDDRGYLEFFDRYHGARANAEAVSLGEIRRAGKDKWQAHAWWLERRNPGVYNPRTRVEHSGPDGGPIDVNNLLISDDDRTRRQDRLRERLAELDHAQKPGGTRHGNTSHRTR